MMQSKRKLITLIGAAALVVASVGIAEAQSERQGAPVARHHDPLIGTWIVTVVPRGRPEFMAISTFNLGGTVAQVDTNPGTTSALGQWFRTGDRTYTQDFLLFNINPFTSTTMVQVDLTLGETLDTFTATYEFQSVAPDGTVLVSGGGTRRGTRATFEFQ